jgi:UDP-N-acetyl-D-glucosamine 4,6-dehydratase
MLSNLFKPTNFKRAIFFLIIDIFLSFFTLFSAYLLRFNFQIPPEYLPNLYKIYFILLLLKISFFIIFKQYQTSWRFFGILELKKLIYATVFAYLSFFIIYLFFKEFFIPFPRSAIIIDFFLSLSFIGLFRVSKRLILESLTKDSKEAVIIGANEKTLSLLKQKLPYSIIDIFDDSDEMVGSYLYGFKVLSIKKLDATYIKTVLITKEYSQKELDNIVKILSKKGFKEIKIYNPFKEKLKDLSIEDLLARQPKDLDKKVIKEFIKGKTILITGAGGSIGSELARQCIKYDAKHLLLLDHSEYNLYKIEQELEGKNITAIMQSVVNRKLLEKTFKEYDIDIVFHAAAYKHVPLCEENVEEAILNNIIGTKNCMDLAVKYDVKKFVMISTDKAVRPTNVMGATKRVCELYGQNLKSKKTEIVSVRFGNVLGSSGSVIPKFKKQIEEGGPITVTHPEITRYFMLIPEACELVLQAGAIGKGEELFILDMGEPVKIVDLAKKMCELSGRDDIEIVYTGLRKGEKLYEELLINEADAKTKYDSIMIAKPTSYNIEKLQKEIEELLQEEDKISILKKIVPEFKHNSI